METHVAARFKHTLDGDLAESILRKCVHCGFCNAVCPTYQLLGDELDGPRGRIYLLKGLFEGENSSAKSRQHLDRCLQCQSCESTCPSGVEYTRLLSIGNEMLDKEVPRSLWMRFKRAAISQILPYPNRFRLALNLARLVKFALPAMLQKQLPDADRKLPWVQHTSNRKVWLFNGCVQGDLAPQINRSISVLLAKNDIQCLGESVSGCCGAASYHLQHKNLARKQIRQQVDTLQAAVDAGVEAIIISSSACAKIIRDYAVILQGDNEYAEKALKISALVKDISEYVLQQKFPSSSVKPLAGDVAGKKTRLSFHSPCSLQHGLKINGVIERLLISRGYDLVPVANPHLCCGSAGTYSLLQPEYSRQLLDDKVNSLSAGKPDIIVSANIGCINYLKVKSRVPVRHWIEMLID